MVPTVPRALLIGSEAVPFAKTGGLADVLGALPPALAGLGWDVTLVLPRYRGVSAGRLVERRAVTVGGVHTRRGVLRGAARRRRPRDPRRLSGALRSRVPLRRRRVDYPDNPQRFAFLVRAALEYAAVPARRPDVVHAHDWQAGLAPVYLRTRYADHPVLGGVPSIFTIHNLAYQGLCGARLAAAHRSRRGICWRIDRMEFWGRISLLKGGITDADWITTVSPRYARGDPDAGVRLRLRRHPARRARATLTGILNGIDTAAWDPAHDPFLPEPFDAASLAGKAAAKRALLARFGLPVDGAALARPLVGMVSRMVDQKGLDLVAAAADRLLAPRRGVRRARHRASRATRTCGAGSRRAHPDARRRAHRVRRGAGAPDRGGRGSLPDAVAVRAVRPEPDVQPALRHRARGAGGGRPGRHRFRRRAAGPAAAAPGQWVRVRGRVGRGRSWRPSGGRWPRLPGPRRWRAIMAAGMAEDHSWDRSAREYVKIYEQVRRTRTAG